MVHLLTCMGPVLLKGLEGLVSCITLGGLEINQLFKKKIGHQPFILGVTFQYLKLLK